ncbi:MAG: hypothetical protein WC730_00155 [Patescibacteria group bacterium]|jgi:DNA-binding response OmpR family regulator
MENKDAILIVSCDPYLAGIYGRKFEENGWAVAVEETIEAGEKHAMVMRPDIILLQTDCVTDTIEVIKRWRSFPTIYSTKIVILAEAGDEEEIRAAREAGAAEYLLVGHFVPQEAVEKMKHLLGS